ncbi:uncharacterized protein LOC131428776 [Malaya genurostris]|uniref:uncharacterized protein LOC131428776 n=1 Tax=Malaya genurostris TaxID=325434 RepID=UPI0026F3E300|nr:uncharacterized protein LOC131428776 [Malaya genurostris]
MAEHLLQRFANMGSSTTAGPPSSMATLNQRVHHEPFVKYPVYGPGSGPDVYEEDGDFWHGGSSPGFFPGGPPVPPPFPFRVPHAKFGKPRFKGASVAVLTFIGFLFFLSVLQNYIRDYSTNNTPTVIVLSSGATKENQQQYPFLQKTDSHLSEEEPDHQYLNYKKTSAHGKRPKNQKRHSPLDVAPEVPSKQTSFSDLISVSDLK